MQFRTNWYVGAPQTGKTTLAVAHAMGDEQPIIVLDAMAGSSQLRLWPRAEDLADVGQRAFSEGTSCRYLPRSEEDVDELARMILHYRGVSLLVDEAHAWVDAHARRRAHLFVLMRATQHARSNLYLTTHHWSGDVSQVAQACAPRLYVFFQTSPRSLKVLEQDYGLAPKRIQALGRGEFLILDTHFKGA